MNCLGLVVLNAQDSSQCISHFRITRTLPEDRITE